MLDVRLNFPGFPKAHLAWRYHVFDLVWMLMLLVLTFDLVADAEIEVTENVYHVARSLQMRYESYRADISRGFSSRQRNAGREALNQSQEWNSCSTN